MKGALRRRTTPLLLALGGVALAFLAARPACAGEPVRADAEAMRATAEKVQAGVREDGRGGQLIEGLIQQLNAAAVVLFLPPVFPSNPPPAPPPMLPPAPPPPPPPPPAPPLVVDPPSPGPVPSPSDTPEPVSLVTGLLGFGLASVYAAYRRRRGGQ